MQIVQDWFLALFTSAYPSITGRSGWEKLWHWMPAAVWGPSGVWHKMWLQQGESSGSLSLLFCLQVLPLQNFVGTFRRREPFADPLWKKFLFGKTTQREIKQKEKVSTPDWWRFLGTKKAPGSSGWLKSVGSFAPLVSMFFVESVHTSEAVHCQKNSMAVLQKRGCCTVCHHWCTCCLAWNKSNREQVWREPKGRKVSTCVFKQWSILTQFKHVSSEGSQKKNTVLKIIHNFSLSPQLQLMLGWDEEDQKESPGIHKLTHVFWIDRKMYMLRVGNKGFDWLKFVLIFSCFQNSSQTCKHPVESLAQLQRSLKARRKSSSLQFVKFVVCSVLVYRKLQQNSDGHFRRVDIT